jgi:Mrp family chromosome partitioning ATPase
MDHIREAIERAKEEPVGNALAASLPAAPSPNGFANGAAVDIEEVRLNAVQLEDNRIIAHDVADPRSKAIDMLRTQVLQSMNLNSWQFLGVTSPTPSCGKSVIAINLALSIARQSERAVLLVDLDFQKPQVAKYLGFKRDRGILGVLEGRTKLLNATKRAHIYNNQLFVLPCEASTPRSSEFMTSRAMSLVLQDIKRDFKSCTVIFDMPPMLASDDVLSILPSIDCVLLVAAAETSTIPEIKECSKFLSSVPVVRFVLNKVSEKSTVYYYGRYGE